MITTALFAIGNILRLRGRDWMSADDFKKEIYKGAEKPKESE